MGHVYQAIPERGLDEERLLQSPALPFPGVVRVSAGPIRGLFGTIHSVITGDTFPEPFR